MRQQKFIVGSHTLTLLWSESFGDPKQISSIHLNDGRLLLDFGKNALVTIIVTSRMTNIRCHVWRIGTIIVKNDHGRILCEETRLSDPPSFPCNFHDPRYDQTN